jgi:hypothetical protein
MTGWSYLFLPCKFNSATDGQHLASAHDCWQVLDQVICLGWFIAPFSSAEPLLDVDELTHYASAAYGAVHIVIPGALISFPTPANDLISP